jgi:dipicolinate synthase subunit A
MAARLASLGARVTAHGLFEGEIPPHVRVASTVQGALGDCHAIILPMPAFDREGKLFCPSRASIDLAITPEWLFAHINRDVPVYGGRLSEAVLTLARACGIVICDYAEMEEVQIRNAVPTVEGALCLAMRSLDVTLWGARAAVLGYGRIGALLAQRLQNLGVHTTVAARKVRDIARIEVAGHRALHIRDEASLSPLTAGFDVIFNTVPHRILTPSLMAAMPKETLMIELASSPGGWDPDAPMSCHALYAPGLPAKHTPKTAGNILADCLWPLLKEVTPL